MTAAFTVKYNYYDFKELNDLSNFNYRICIMPRNFGKTYTLNNLIEKQVKRKTKMKFKHHKRLLKDLVKFDFYHMFTPYQQRCIDETIRIIYRFPYRHSSCSW